MNVDLELYRVFCEVVKYKNISKAAESMYISQSAVTQSIQKLETILGGKVFYRNKTGVELPEEWKGLNGSDLQLVTGVRTASFCHPAGFIGGAETFADAYALAKKAVEA